VEADVSTVTELPPTLPKGRRVGLLLGSAIGTLHPAEAKAFLRRACTHLGRDGILLMGIDLKKDPALLHAAYNDTAGVTSTFNMNGLRHLGHACNAVVDVEAFEHYAFYNPAAGRVETHLVAKRSTAIAIGGHTIRFAAGEGVWTGSAYKYTLGGVDQLARESGFTVLRCWTDPENWYAVVAIIPKPSQRIAAAA
jgi:uncharacterized SAM-dependent methyltransferase